MTATVTKQATMKVEPVDECDLCPTLTVNRPRRFGSIVARACCSCARDLSEAGR